MAPRMQRDYHSTIGDPARYSLRILKHGESNLLQPRNVDVSKIAGKEDFLRCVGLQLKRSKYDYKMSNGDCSIKKINIPNGVMLRECCVVIQKQRCKLCRKCFKCETDLNVHHALKHRTDVKGIQCTENEIDVWKRMSKSLEATTIESSKSFDSKLHKRLRLTLKIGEEVVAKISVKRKHLRGNKVDTCTQTEPYIRKELIITEDVMNGVVGDADEGVVSRIDPLVSPCQCCNSSVQVVNSLNQYSASNIVSSGQSLCRESTAQEENHASSRLQESCATFRSTNSTATLNVLPFDSNVNFKDQCNLPNSAEDNDNSKNFSLAQLNNNLKPSEVCCTPQFSKISTSAILEPNQKDSVTILTEDTNISSKRNTSLEVQSSGKDSKERDTNIEENEIQRDLNVRRKEKPVSRNATSNMVQVMMPVILPIIVPNKNASSSPLNLTIYSTATQPEQQCTQQQMHQGQQQQLRQVQQQVTNNFASNSKDNSGNEIEEVLRIVRRSSTSSDINHESPTRFEQEMLVQDAIRDMKRMEEQGWHLLEKRVPNIITSTKKRKRNVTKATNVSKGECLEECAKKIGVMVEPNSECNAAGNATEERLFSNTEGHVAKVQSYSGTVTVCATNNVKDNLLMCNNDIHIPLDVLQQYGINYYNEVFEINNNRESIQKPVSLFLASCSGAMENRSNRPAVIDLVNDTDE